MNILVIGKNGQLGEAFAAQTSDAWNVLLPGREQFDLLKTQQMEHYIQEQNPAMVINAAAYNLVPQSDIDPTPAFAINTFAVWQLAGICKKMNIPFVTYSTDYVFDGKKGAPYVEDDQPQPLQMYGISKYAGELATLNAND